MESQVLNSADILLSIFPSIEDQLICIANKFERDLSVAVERKSGKIIYNTPALASLLTRFPHSYSSYSKCVNDFVDVGRNSSDAAISVLFKLLPIRAKCDLYHRIIPKIAMDPAFDQILDLFLTLFFADCVTQILTEKPDTKYYHSLILIGYKNAAKFSEEYEEPLRVQIVKQFSVIFSLLSINHLNELITRFNNFVEKYDIGLSLLLNRYIRLSVTQEVSFETYKRFIDKFADFSDVLKKDRRSLDMWAEAFCSLLTQIKPEAADSIKDALKKIFKTANTMASDKETVKWYLMLCSVIIIRYDALYKKEYATFIQERILKKKERLNKLEAKLNSFLIIIRGPNSSRSTQFWEWGQYNATAHHGIEISFINDPTQKQDAPDSYTNMFFDHFVADNPIEKFPDVVGDILVNFASRDFNHFMLTTIPNLIAKLGEERSMLSLHACLSQLVDTHAKFAGWAQSSPLNKKIRVDVNIHSFFMQIKSLLLKSIDKITPQEFTNDAYCFELDESPDVPVFSLPYSTSPLSEATKSRIAHSTEIVTKALEEWEFADNSIGYDLTIDFSTYESTTKNERFTIKMLSFLPIIINTSDLSAHDRIENLLTTVLSSSRSISYYALRVINQIFIVNESARIIIYNAIINKILSTINRHHVFILIQFLVKLLDKTLPLDTNKEQNENFVIECQSLFLLLMCYHIVEIRELALNFIEKIQRFASGMEIEVPIFDTLNDNSSLISAAVRSHIYVHNTSRLDTPPPTDNLCTYSEVATSRSDNLFQYYIEESMCALQRPNCIPVLIRTHQIITQAMSLFGDCLPCDLPPSRALLYQNFLTVLTHTSPVLNPLVQNRMKNELNLEQNVANYRNTVFFTTTNEKHLQQLTDNRDNAIKVASSLVSYLKVDEEHPDRVKNSVNFFKHIHWTILCDLLPVLGEFVQKEPVSTNIDLLSYISEIFSLIGENSNIMFALAANDDAKNAFAKYFQAAEAYFLENKLNGSRRFTDVSQMNQTELLSRKQTCLAYCRVVNFFLSALTPIKIYPAEGAIRIPEQNPWLKEGNWKDSEKKITLAFLVNWGKLNDSDNADYFDLANAASLAIIAFIRVINIFSPLYVIPTDLESIIINLEKEGHNALQSILTTHYDYMMPVFLGYAYNAPPDLAPMFFKAICMQFTNLSLDTKKIIADQMMERFAPQKLAERTSSYLSLSPGIKRMARVRTMIQDLTVNLSNRDLEYNKQFAEYAGKFIPISLIYLLHEDFTLRQTSFKFLQRIACTAHHLLNTNKDDGKQTALFVKKLQQLAPSFFSTHVSITVDIIMNVAELFAEYLPQVSEVLIQEVFTQITTAAKGSLINQSIKATLLQITSLFMRNLKLDKNNNWPSSFVFYTPYSLMMSLLDILPSIDQNSFSHYLSLWTNLANNEENANLIIKFLVQASSDVSNERSVKVVMLHLAKRYSKNIIEELVHQLTFACWWNNTMQGRIQSDAPPSHETQSVQSYIAILKTLTDLSQAYPQEVSNYIHIIVNFCLLFYDIDPALNAELMLIILWSMPQCPESLVSIFAPPCALIWSRASGIEFTENMKKDDNSVSFTLRQYRKEPVSIVDFTNQFVSFLRKHNKTEQACEWGKEALKWACGCGNLEVAGRACLLYSEILEPLDSNLVTDLINAFKVVTACNPDNTRRFYISTIIKALESVVDIKAEDKEFKDSIEKIALVVHPLIKYPEEESLCISALAIFAKYILCGDISNELLIDTINSIAPLFGCLSRQEALIGILLAIFSKMKDRTDTKMPLTLFTFFLPTIFKMVSAQQNIQPYTSVVTDDTEIKSVLESLLMIAQCKCFNEDIQQYIFTTIGSLTKESIHPSAFILGIAMHLISIDAKSVMDAAPLFTSLVYHSSPDMMSAVFSTISSIIEASNCAAPFSAIVEFSTRIASIEAVKVQEAFLRDSQNPDKQKIAGQQIYAIVEHRKWSDIVKIIGDPTFTTISGDSALDKPIPMAPIDEDLWKEEKAQKAKEAVQDIIVQPFTGTKKIMDDMRVAALYKEGGEIQVDRTIGGYLSYKNALKDIQE